MIGIHRTCCCDLTADFIMPGVGGPSSDAICDLDYAFWYRPDPHGQPPEDLHTGPMYLAVGYPLNFTGSIWPRHEQTLGGCSLPDVEFQLICNPNGKISRTYSNFIQGNYLYFPFMIHPHQRPWRPCPTGTLYQPECVDPSFRHPVTWCNNYVDYGIGVDDYCHDLYPNLQWFPSAWSVFERDQLIAEGLSHVWDTMIEEGNQSVADERNHWLQEYGISDIHYSLPPGLFIRRGSRSGGYEWGYSFGRMSEYVGGVTSAAYAPKYLLKITNHPILGSQYVLSTYSSSPITNAAWPIAETNYMTCSAIIKNIDNLWTPLSCNDFHNKDIYYTTPIDWNTAVFDRFTIVATSQNPKIKTIDSYPGFNYYLDHPRMANFFGEFVPRPYDFITACPSFVDDSWFDFVVSHPSYYYYGEVDCSDSCWT